MSVVSESRYLLILTENYAALGILQQELLKIKNAIIIFGSSFPKDQEYTQVDIHTLSTKEASSFLVITLVWLF